MTTNYRDPAQSVPSEEEATSSSSSSSSGEESQVVPRVLTSSSSQYFVQSVLGKGVYGKVVKCVKTATRETVAVKILKDNDVTAEVQNEMDVLEQLRAFDSDRFNFVRFNDCFIDREHICFEFEMLDMSLWDFLQKKPSCSLSVKEIRPVVHQMATALQLLKNMGIVHTDIKPDNIMMVDHVNQPMKIKLIDFGLACHVSESDWGISASPLAYRAPENILGFPVTPALDMWALGCVAAELFTGNLLYLGHSEYAMLRYMVQSQGQLPQRLLKDGINTKYFFRRKGRRRRRWRLKTSKEYGHTSWSKTCSASLDDLTKVKLVCHLSDEDTKAEIEDRENFVNLLKKMLHLDVDKRITPSHLLEDPFITMNDLADSHPNTFYVKSCCEMMEVCQDQSLRADNRDQASTSLTSVHQNLPAWLSHQEHPLILELASAFSCLAISTDQDPSEPQGKDEESTQPELLLPIRATDQQKRRRTPLHHSTQVAIEVPEPDVHAPFQSEVCQTTQNQELCQNSKEAPTEIPSSAVERKPQRKRTWDTFIASHLGLRKNPVSGSPMRKVMKMSILHNSIQAPTKAPSNEAEMKPRRKRTWDTFIASHLGLRKNPVSGSPMRKVMKMSVLHTSIQATTKAPSNEAEMKPRRKRTWDTFIASHLGLRKNPVSGPPMRKVMKMSILHTSIQAPTKAPSNEAEMKPRRKRTWDTFFASHLGLWKNPDGSPERKRMKMSLEICDSQQTSSSEVDPSESNRRSQDCSSRGRKRKRNEEG
ncbi:homeodomain-interacting protein kinase 3-like [Larimichthys crocea]|uniref:homeodomain-interacting protein kinase 3-like n=1 Tax=Larimichthys crocea TaxID=215358 RepID=UPI000F5DE499|nr:homeodomain-interacting protein kinase 3-like [Larimichthys crocea]